jgi:arylsulfatase
MLGDHYHWRKTYAYEGSARIPFVVRYPRSWGLPRGQVLDQVVELRDVMPTLLEAAGVEIPGSVDGQSVLTLARGETAGWREYVQGEHTVSYGLEWGNQWLTDGREKYVWFHHTDRELFFNLEQDPAECHDLSNNPDVQQRVALWRERLAQINERRGDPRGHNGRLVPQPQGALRLSPSYQKWRERAAVIDHGARP